MSDGVEVPAERGFGTNRAAKIVNLTYRQLDYWARTGLVEPSLLAAKGSGSRRSYSYGDLLELKVIKRLLDAGIDLKRIRIIFSYVRNELRQDISSAALIIDGPRSAVVRDQDALIDALRSGQGVLPLAGLQGEVDAAILDFAKARDAADSATDQTDVPGSPEGETGDYPRATGTDR